MNSDEARGFFSGVISIVFVLTVFWHALESSCQREHDVADCTIEINTVPVIQEEQQNDNK